MKEKCIEKEVIYEGKIIRVEKDAVLLEDGHQSVREVVFNSGGVSVLAFTKKKQIILIKQFRYPSKEELYELPGGKVDGNETFIETGIRELQEESGYVSEGGFEYFGYFYPTVAYCNETIHLVVVKDCVFKKQMLDVGEHVDVELVDFKEAKQMIFDNQIKDAKTIIAILKYDSIRENELL